MRPRDKALEEREIRGGEPQLLKVLEQNIGIEYSKYKLLTKGDREGRDAEFHLDLIVECLDSPILWPTLLRDVHSSECLYPAHHRALNSHRDSLNGVENAVDA